MNSYVNVPITKKVWTVSDSGHKSIIVRALHDLKSAGATFCKHLDDRMKHVG